jgi:hypothetical protein
VVDIVGNAVGVDIRGANKVAVPLILPFIAQTQQSVGELVAGSSVTQQLFNPQPSWP